VNLPVERQWTKSALKTAVIRVQDAKGSRELAVGGFPENSTDLSQTRSCVLEEESRAGVEQEIGSYSE
jgi:hypothetical protein